MCEPRHACEVRSNRPRAGLSFNVWSHSDVKPLLDRFDAMDVDGSGTLEVADLAWMFVQARENHQPPPPERDEEQFQRKSFFFPMKVAGPLLKAASFKKSKVAPGA